MSGIRRAPPRTSSPLRNPPLQHRQVEPTRSQQDAISRIRGHNEKPKRSSSIYSRSTKLFDGEGPMYNHEPPPPLPNRPYAVTAGLTDSSSNLLDHDEVSPLTPELTTPLPPMLEPRTYTPLMPSPLPSRNSSNSSVSEFFANDNVSNDGSWKEYPLRRDSEMNPSPEPMTPMPFYLHGQSRSNIDLRVATGQIETPNVSAHLRSRSDESAPTPTAAARLTRPFGSPPEAPYDTWRNNSFEIGVPESLAHSRNDSIDNALSHMRLGSDITTPEERECTPSDSRRSDTESLSFGLEDDVLSSECRDKLIDEYKDLATPTAPPMPHTTKQWQEHYAAGRAGASVGRSVASASSIASSDLEDKGRDLKLVPEPLFWKNRQRELYPNRIGYAEQRKAGQVLGLQMGKYDPPTRKHKKRVSLSKAPLQMMLPQKYKRKSYDPEVTITPQEDDSPTTTSLKNALKLRMQQKKSISSPEEDVGVRTKTGKAISKPTGGPLPLQLPDVALKDVQGSSSPVASPPLTAQVAPTLPAPSAKDRIIPKFNLFPPKTSHEKGEWQEMEPSPYGAPKIPLHPPPINTSSGLFHRRGNSGDSKKSHTRNKSSTSSTGSHLPPPPPFASAFSPIDERRSVMMGVFDKALDFKRERDQNKRKKELKSQIKVVGQTSLTKEAEKEERNRKYSEGGWI